MMTMKGSEGESRRSNINCNIRSWLSRPSPLSAKFTGVTPAVKQANELHVMLYTVRLGDSLWQRLYLAV